MKFLAAISISIKHPTPRSSTRKPCASSANCLRANKSLCSFGVEVRVPFLYKEFMDVAMRLNPADKMAGKDKIEKYFRGAGCDVRTVSALHSM